MGAPKQKWTAEEEAALRAGVEKYGPGKWRAIQKDSKFGPCLTSRSNVDLKVRNSPCKCNSNSSRVVFCCVGSPLEVNWHSPQFLCFFILVVPAVTG